MALLEARSLSVRFGGHHAVRDVDLTVGGGEVVGLIGPNGAGKTTTFNALAGVVACTGKVLLDERDVSDAPPHLRARLGLTRTFQRLEVFGSMSAYDNVLTAAEIALRGRREPLRRARATADEVMDLLNLGGIGQQRADALPTGQARLVELGRSLATSPRIVLLDEPASGLDEVETERLGVVLRGLQEQGLAVLLVEHHVEFVMQLCARLYVLDLGEVMASGTPEIVRADPAVRAAYLGTAEPEGALAP